MKNKVDDFGRTDLHYAPVDLPGKDQVKAIKRLIKSGADINLQDNNGCTPLHFAAQEHSVSVVKVLLEAGAKVDLVDQYGNSPLFTAVMHSGGKGEIIELLREYGADPYKKNNYGNSPVSTARKIGNYDVAQFFADLPEEES
jgi:ankyrin repeat protein